jgi:hypothetical protein
MVTPPEATGRIEQVLFPAEVSIVFKGERKRGERDGERERERC